MTEWRFIPDDELEDILSKAEVIKTLSGTKSHTQGIFRCVDGVVRRNNELLTIPPDHYVKILDDHVDEEWCYSAESLVVEVFGFPSRVKKGVPVAVFSRELMEKAVGTSESRE